MKILGKAKADAMKNVARNRTRAGLRLLVLFTACSMLAVSFGQAQTPGPGLKSAPVGQTSGSGRVALYAAVGDDLSQYEVDIANGTLVKQSSVTLPGNSYTSHGATAVPATPLCPPILYPRVTGTA